MLGFSRSLCTSTLGSVAFLFAALAGCGSDPESPDGPGQGGEAGQGGEGTGGSSTGPAGPSGSGGAGPAGPGGAGGSGGAGGAGPTFSETEPNDAKASFDEAEDLPVGATALGAIGAPGDQDAFKVPTEAGKLYAARLTLPPGSALVGHLAVLDAGRSGKKPGDDYIQLSRMPESGPEIVFWAMGEGGHYVAVNDARSFGGASEGSSEHGYALRVVEVGEAAYTGQPLAFPSTISDSLAHAGSLRLYPFTAQEGMDVLIDLQASGEMDGRLFVVSRATKSWFARQDDRAAGDSDPLIDAPLTEGGEALLVVENVEQEATALGYVIQASAP